jgi:hypothetical protein
VFGALVDLYPIEAVVDSEDSNDCEQELGVGIDDEVKCDTAVKSVSRK